MIIKTNRERGNILIVTLVLLTIMTVAAVSLLDSSQFQALMARNFQFSDRVFEQSLGEIEGQFAELHRNDADMIRAMVNQGAPQTLTAMSAVDTNFTQTITLEYSGEARPPIGYSLTGGGSVRLLLQSDVNLGARSISSNQTQALTYVRPE